MTIHPSTDIDFESTNVIFSHDIYNYDTSPDGVYLGDGTALMPDVKKVYRCSRDYSVQDKYIDTGTSKYRLFDGEVIKRGGKWYEVLQDIDLTFRDSWYGGSTNAITYPYVIETRLSTVVEIAQLVTTASDGSITTSTNGSTSTTHTYVTQIECVNKNGSIVKQKSVYKKNTSTGLLTELSRNDMETLCYYAPEITNNKYESGAIFLKRSGHTATGYSAVQIVNNAPFPAYNNTAYFKPLPMYETITVGNGYNDKYKILGVDNRNYNGVEVVGDTIYSGVKPIDNSLYDGIFLSGVKGSSVEITINGNIYKYTVPFYPFTIFHKLSENDIGMPADIKVVKQKDGKSTIGTILMGLGEDFGGLELGTGAIIPEVYDFSEIVLGVLETKAGERSFDYEGVIKGSFDTKGEILASIARTGYKLCGFDMNEGCYNNAWERTIGTFSHYGKIPESKDEFSIPVVVRSMI